MGGISLRALMMPTSVHLGCVLGLSPMDRVQVRSDKVFREAAAFLRLSISPGDPRRKEGVALPYWFVQATCADGRLVVRSPSGYKDYVDPLDVCDIQQGTPLRVRAVPVARFLDSLRTFAPSGRSRFAPADFHWATVMFVSRAKRGVLDGVHVRFDDDDLNGGDRWDKVAVPIQDDDRRMLEKRARRTIMPVVSRTSAPWSADQGLSASERKHERAVRKFIQERIDP